MDLFEAYVKVWRLAEADGIFVHYHGLLGDGLAGYFHPRDNFGWSMKPEIVIRRPYYKEPDDEPARDSNAPPDKPQPDLLAELFTLAHEYGHSRSWAGRTPAADYALYDEIAKRRDAIADEEFKQLDTSSPPLARNDDLRRALHARLSDDDRMRIIHEETLAWAIGREVLVGIGFEDLAGYDATTTRHLHNHRYRLGMEEAWPGDFDEIVAD